MDHLDTLTMPDLGTDIWVATRMTSPAEAPIDEAVALDCEGGVDDDDFHGCCDCNDVDDADDDVIQDIEATLEDAAEILAVSEELTDDGRATPAMRDAAAGLGDRPSVAELMRTRRRAVSRRR